LAEIHGPKQLKLIALKPGDSIELHQTMTIVTGAKWRETSHRRVLYRAISQAVVEVELRSGDLEEFAGDEIDRGLPEIGAKPPAEREAVA
jgi:hypothetical protein